jgi:SAM-dependent methyltransferase
VAATGAARAFSFVAFEAVRLPTVRCAKYSRRGRSDSGSIVACSVAGTAMPTSTAAVVVSAASKSLITLASASAKGATLNAVVSDVDAFDFGKEQWDLITSFYMHGWHRRSPTDVAGRIFDALKPGGVLVIEGFGEPKRPDET